MTKYAFFEGKVVPIEDAKVSIMTHALQYGTGCFEGVRAYWNPDEKQLFVFRLREHFERLHQSGHILHIDIPYSVDELIDILIDLLKREDYKEDVYIRPFAYKNGTAIGVNTVGVPDAFAIYTTRFGRYMEKEEGCKAMVSSWRRNNDNAIPARAKVTGGYINSALIKAEATLNGYDAAIVLNDDGHVSEGSTENLFLIRRGKLVTTPVTENILEGITRATIMQVAREVLGMEVIERCVDRSELYVVEEAFFCGTGVQIAAIISVDQRNIGSGEMGPNVQKIRDLYFRIVRGYEPRYRDWLTPVYK
jgi:branched-chain amino acid aminotransferase